MPDEKLIVPDECPECGSDSVEIHTRTEVVRCGRDGDGFVADLPLRRCVRCGFGYLDSWCAAAEHAAVCHHLGLLSPAEILSLRSATGLTPADFAVLAGVDVYDLLRWEAGNSVQSPEEDGLLRRLAGRLKKESAGGHV